MHQSMKAIFFGILSLVMAQSALAEESHAAHHETKAEQPVISTSGVIKDIDFNHKKITIAHKAIPEIGWPAMTMRFTFATADNVIRDLQPGNHVNFSFVQQGNISQLQAIQVTQP